jgi:hypothetical protein
VRWTLALAGLAASWGLIAVIAAAVEMAPVPLAFLRLAALLRRVPAQTAGVLASCSRSRPPPPRVRPQ